jgi:peptidoglycan/xylan/chitin deacetylase (PgdA/CDA1 family)
MIIDERLCNSPRATRKQHVNSLPRTYLEAALGWKGYTKKQILKRVLDGRKPGAIYLFHVGSQSKDGPALQSIISELRKRGYGFVTINKRHLPPL